ncbi:ABC transporter permease [Leekyejoonella antrihumi]|uniref:ABC transporter permease n=1 Tax=Leekyejoonella antrihumi TaxID=1660198 RepID=A0A563E0I2_9MICO|nr:ABC transporter permease [Leekyejoonella antrihumi]TWP36027.1 ABC transporter permease [Leekyejoonella antrihumi]
MALQSKTARAAGSRFPDGGGPAKRSGRERRQSVGNLSITAAVIIGIIVVWWIITAAKLVQPLFVPSPAATWQAFTRTLFDGYQGHSLIIQLLISVRRVLIAFALASILAVPLGILVGANQRLRAALDPLVNFYRVLPPLAYYTILVIWLGIGETSKVALLFLAGFAPIFIAVVDAIRGVPTDRVDAARSLGASKSQVLRAIILPSLLPATFTGMRVALGFTYTTVVAAEMVAANSGIGWMVLDASRYLKSDVIFMGIIVMGITGVILDSAIKYTSRKVVPWQGKG